MKKALIAGAASLAIAAMPVVGVFAVGNDGTITDTLELEIENTCAMTIADAERTADTAKIADGAWGVADAGENATFTGTVIAGQEYVDFATTNFQIVCNDNDGYKVTVATTGFEATGVDSATYPWGYNAGQLATGEDSSWTIKSTGNAQTLTANSGDKNVVATRGNALTTAGESFAVSYSAKVASDQPAGVYTATAAYTFAQL